MSNYLSTGGLQDVASMTLKVTSDPALPEVLSLIGEIKGLSSNSSSPSGPATPGVGLSKIVKPLRYYIAYRKRPWIAPVFIGGVILTIFAFGAASGRRRRAPVAP